MKVAAFHDRRQLPEADLEQWLDACPWCGGVDLTSVAVVQASPRVELRRCGRCDACGVSRLPTADALDRYYAGYYDDDQAAVTMDKPRRLARRIAGYAPDRSELSVLDLGGGDGTIAALVMAERSASGVITVVDYDHRRRADTPVGVKLEHIIDLAELDENERFDLVIASAVLEHLRRPAPVLGELLARVAPGGSFYARTPFVAPFLAVAGRLGTTVDFTFPAHLHDLGPRFWNGLDRWLPEMNRFEVLVSRPSPVETSFDQHPVRTAVAAAAKAPWQVFRSWPFVGGWELAAQAREREV